MSYSSLNCKICKNPYLILSRDGICIDCIEKRNYLVKAYRENRLVKILECIHCNYVQATNAVYVLRCHKCGRLTRVNKLRILWQGNDAHQAIEFLKKLKR
ncbi:MAG: hypothetical protein QXD42_06860 [Nitrososphaerales archaeon]